MKKFVEELRKLMKEHNVYLDNNDNYDSDDKFTGTDYYFVQGNYQVHVTELTPKE